MKIAEIAAGTTIGQAALADLAAGILKAAGLRPDDAAAAATLLVECHRRGIDSHGLAHLPVYVRRILSGAIDPLARPVISSGNGPSAMIDGRNALGILVGLAAMTEAGRRARLHGVGIAAVRDSNHFGAAAPLVDRTARDGLVALAFSNAAPTMAPWGGREALLGTNPIAAAFPRAGNTPIVIDMATSTVSRGRLRQAALKGETIPADWALDAEGRPTTDARAGLDGTVQPLGGAKGYALTLMVELLCTTLTGGRPGFLVRNPHDPSPEPAGTSHLFLAFDPAHFAGAGTAAAVAAKLGARIEGSTPAAGGTPRLPGARAAAEALRRDADGIPLTTMLIRQLTEAAQLIEGRD